MPAPVSRQQIIDEATKIGETLKSRGETHGSGRENFDVSAELLNAMGFRRAYVDRALVEEATRQLDALDVCVIYDMLKSARERAGDRLEPDHYFDKAGYNLIAAAIAKAEQRERPKPPMSKISLEEARKHTRDPCLKSGDVVLTREGPRHVV